MPEPWFHAGVQPARRTVRPEPAVVAGSRDHGVRQPMGITRRDALAGVLWGAAAGTVGRGARGQQAPSPAAEYAAVRQYADVRALAERIARENFPAPPRGPERFAQPAHPGHTATLGT